MAERLTEYIIDIKTHDRELVKEVCEKVKRQCVYCHINGEVYYKISPEALKIIQKGFEK